MWTIDNLLRPSYRLRQFQGCLGEESPWRGCFIGTMFGLFKNCRILGGRVAVNCCQVAVRRDVSRVGWGRTRTQNWLRTRDSNPEPCG